MIMIKRTSFPVPESRVIFGTAAAWVNCAVTYMLIKDRFQPFPSRAIFLFIRKIEAKTNKRNILYRNVLY